MPTYFPTALTLALCAPIPATPIGHSLVPPAVMHFTQDHGLPILAVHDLAQDREGRIWVATQQGPAFLAAQRFQTLAHEHEAAKSFTLRLLPTSQGIWMGTLGKGLHFRSFSGQWQSWATFQGRPLPRIRDLDLDANQDLLISPLGMRTLRLQNGQLQVAHDFPDVPFYGLTRGPEGWLGASAQGLWRQKGQQWTQDPQLKGTVFSVLAQGQRLLASTPQGPKIFNGKTWISVLPWGKHLLLRTCLGPGIHEPEAIWGVTSEALFCFESQKTHTIQLPQGAATNIISVRCTQVSGRSQLWITTMNGLYRLTLQGWQKLRPEEGPGSHSPRSLALTSQGVWAGESWGQVHRFSKDAFQTWNLNHGHRDGFISPMAPLPDHPKGLVALHNLSGLWFWNGFQWKSMGWGKLQKRLPVLCMSPGRFRGRPGVYFANEAQLAFASPQDGIEVLSDLKDPIWWILPDPKHPGRLYTGGMASHVRTWEPSGWKDLGDLQGAPYSLCGIWEKGAEGQRMRIGTFDRGVIGLDTRGNRLDPWHGDTRPGFTSNNILSLTHDALGRYWIGTTRGVVVTDPKGEVLKTYTEEDGLPSNLCTSGGILYDGSRVWVATSQGLSYLAWPQHITNPLPGFKLLKAESSLGPFEPGATLPHSVRNVRFSFQFPHLHREKDLRFRMALEGINEAHSLWTSSDAVVFPTLPSGRHHLLAWAQSPDGQILGPLRIPFTVAKPLWLHPALLGLYALGTLGLGLLAIQWRTQRLKRRNETLSTLVDQATSDLKRTNEKLNELNESKNRIMSIAAHDLRSPLSSIQIHCELLEREIKDPAKEKIEQIRHLSAGMNDLIQELLDVDAIETQRVEQPIMDVVDPWPLIRVVHTVLEPRARKKEIQLILEPTPLQLLVLGDERHILRVLENLISNAIKFSPPQKEIRLRYFDQGGAVRFEVQDQGPGLTQSDLGRVFGHYARLSASPTGGEASVGLGLCIVKALVEGMGGRVGVESQPKQGATFWFTLNPPTPSNSRS